MNQKQLTEAEISTVCELARELFLHTPSTRIRNIEQWLNASRLHQIAFCVHLRTMEHLFKGFDGSDAVNERTQQMRSVFHESVIKTGDDVFTEWSVQNKLNEYEYERVLSSATAEPFCVVGLCVSDC